MLEEEWHGSVGFGRRSDDRDSPSVFVSVICEELVSLVAEFEGCVFRLIATTVKPEALAGLAFWSCLVAFDAALLACHAAIGSPVVDQGVNKYQVRSGRRLLLCKWWCL